MICVPVMEKTVARTVRTLQLLEHHNPDLVEIRFDLMKSPSSIFQIRDATDRPLIATNRGKGQGGLFSGTEEMRLETLLRAAQDAFDYVDVELNTRNVNETVRRLKHHGARIIVSYHSEKLTPGPKALESILARQKCVGADICKIIGTAKSYADNLRCLTFVNKHARTTKLVCFSMGKLGIPSRVLSPIHGACFTFASSGAGRETASGQIPIDRLRTLYKELGVV